MLEIKSILVIDDESTVRALLKEVVSDMECNYFEAARAEKGLRILEKEEISLIFLDIQLPNINGLDVLPKIKELYPNIPIYLISAFHSMEDVIKNMKIDINGFIPKPFDIHKIRDIVQRELEEGEK
jgi:DNA-binding NtrC family response regulator